MDSPPHEAQMWKALTEKLWVNVNLYMGSQDASVPLSQMGSLDRWVFWAHGDVNSNQLCQHVLGHQERQCPSSTLAHRPRGMGWVLQGRGAGCWVRILPTLLILHVTLGKSLGFSEPQLSLV